MPRRWTAGNAVVVGRETKSAKSSGMVGALVTGVANMTDDMTQDRGNTELGLEEKTLA